MYSLNDKFDEVCLRLGHGRRFESAGSDPIFYLVFPVSEILTVKRRTRAWIAKLENLGWRVVTLSMAKAVNAVLREHKLRKQWLLGEHTFLEQVQRNGGAIDFGDINKTLAKALTEGPELVDLLKAKVEEASATHEGLLLISDLEALHPYLRINYLESKLQGNVRSPVLVLYPGKREGKTSLRFLEFYPPDPNYRSEHIG
jgi:hypothetical protein